MDGTVVNDWYNLIVAWYWSKCYKIRAVAGNLERFSGSAGLLHAAAPDRVALMFGSYQIAPHYIEGLVQRLGPFIFA